MATFTQVRPLPYAGRFLFQQYIVDATCKVGARRLNYLPENQKVLEADNYEGVMDYVTSLDSGSGACHIGRPIILPSTYAGSPDCCQQNCLDAMVIARKTWKPDCSSP